MWANVGPQVRARGLARDEKRAVLYKNAWEQFENPFLTELQGENCNFFGSNTSNIGIIEIVSGD